ncbi:hypothetical protein J40TS1_40170 [Paenibacillus montaniterrae]|uniref:Uncharacterized protein n=1 Tax=Paenibacillus montaniterrae TaxID=429341 RepID=A0A919YRJ4_9BACL|nr:hypothetical protein [Paenibacillus montaniterrae]GIP18375.1 hypothetical protein J40TS1_40170 [Paenibacillus montaniterrae]
MDYTGLLAILGTLSGIALGWIGKARQAKQDARSSGERDASMRIDVEYIKRGVDDVRVEQKLQGQRFDALSERVTRVEESTKHAHTRIDRIESET